LENKIKEENIKFFTILDQQYPESFKTAYKPPFVLFYKGNKELLQTKELYFLTGDTNTSEHVKRNIDSLLQNSKNKYKKINSLHKGVEELIYEKSHKENNTIFICANSINKPDSAFNISDIDLKNNLIISEYYDNEHVTRVTLQSRNRLLVALAKVIILISSNNKS
jgi:DNA processing protein